MARAIRKKMPLIVLDGTAILPTMAIQLEFPRKSGLIDICEDAMKKNKNLQDDAFCGNLLLYHQ